MSEESARGSVTNAMPQFVGRARELEQFRRAFDRMLSRHRQVLLVSGDPGIGKTCYAEAIADIAEGQGALVLWGRCYEEPGTPPYWPWTLVLRGYVDASSPDEARLMMGSGVREISSLLPELADDKDRVTNRPAADSDPAQLRFRTFDSIARFLGKATLQVPLVLIFDNLHWADAPSLSLLEFCCRELAHQRVLVVGTYRDSEISRKSPLLHTLGGLGSDAGVDRVPLAGLSANDIAEVAERLCGMQLGEEVLGAIYRHTDGNPLFAAELIKELIDASTDVGVDPIQVRIPDGVRETIGRRLSRLSSRCNDLLTHAAVFGRYFSAADISGSAKQDLGDVLAELEPAVRARIIEADGEPAGRYRFTHALIRETLYEEISALERLRLHGKAGDVLVGLHSSRSANVLPRVAHHYYESASLGNADKAVEFAMKAAANATRISAFEEALSHYNQAISVLDMFLPEEDERLTAAYVGKGSVLKELGHVQESIESLLLAVSRIRDLGDAELLVDVVMRLAISSSHVPQQHIVPLLEGALSALPEGDDAARAKALATLAFAYRSAADGTRAKSLVNDALEMAKRLKDRVVLGACYQLCAMALRGSPDNLPYRLSVGREYVALTRGMEETNFAAEACHWQALNLIESGNLGELEALLRRYESLPLSEFGLHQYRLESARVTLALLHGEWPGLEDRIEGLREMGMSTRRDDADGVYGAQMFALNRDLGRLPGLEPTLRQFVNGGQAPAWKPGVMLMCAELGLLEDARQLFERLAKSDFASICQDDMYVTCLVFCAETCSRLKDAERARLLYDLLLPYAEQTANHPTAVCFGAAALYLGILAHAMDETDLAERHFEVALERNRDMSAWPWLARTRLCYGAMLIEQADAADRRRGKEQLNEAERLSDRLAMKEVTREVSALLRSDIGETYPDGLTAREVEVLQLLAIGRSNKDISRVLSISLNTVATHVRSILNKSGCANRTEAAAYAMRHELNLRPETEGESNVAIHD